MGGALYQWPKARWSRKIHLRLRQNPQGNQREAGKTEIDDRRTAYRQLPHDGERAFFMVSGKDRGEAVHARQICICDRESYPAAARFCFHCIRRERWEKVTGGDTIFSGLAGKFYTKAGRNEFLPAFVVCIFPLFCFLLLRPSLSSPLSFSFLFLLSSFSLFSSPLYLPLPLPAPPDRPKAKAGNVPRRSCCGEKAITRPRVPAAGLRQGSVAAGQPEW